ncbi:hypothetical protein BRC78_07985 [Halobacteriales archaeon QH_8_68_33]|nr:MAG: hypothetical protein BRC78_07985 [Halobacteriales archaeon QH_8_68_33]
MNRREKLAVYLVVQFVAVAVLAAVVGRMLGRFPFGDPVTRPVVPISARSSPSSGTAARWSTASATGLPWD